MDAVVVLDGDRVVVRELVPAQIVQVQSAGPQGPVGDVNPEMYVLRDAAAASELAAAASATSASGSAASATASAAAARDSELAAAASAALHVPSDATPLVNGTATPGTDPKFSRADHVHPQDATKANVAGQVFTGTVEAPDFKGNLNWTYVQGAPTFLLASALGSTVQPYDLATAKTNAAQNFTAPQRSAMFSDNDLSFDLSAKQNFKCTPTAGGTLTFTNHADGLSGYIILVNGSNYAISAAATTKISAAALARIGATGTYRLDYASDGTNTYVTASESLA